MSNVHNRNYISISGWMINELNLKGNELLVYAIIYGLSQVSGQVFEGSLSYLADWTNSTKQGVLKNLKSLEGKGYIARIEDYKNGVKFVKYYATELNGVLNNVERGIKQSLPNNIKDNIEDNIDTPYSDENGVMFKKNDKKPTLREIQDYCRERNNHVDAVKFKEKYDRMNWMLNGEKIYDWKALIRKWEQYDKASEKPTEKASYDLGKWTGLEISRGKQ